MSSNASGINGNRYLDSWGELFDSKDEKLQTVNEKIQNAAGSSMRALQEQTDLEETSPILPKNMYRQRRNKKKHKAPKNGTDAKTSFQVAVTPQAAGAPRMTAATQTAVAPRTANTCPATLASRSDAPFQAVLKNKSSSAFTLSAGSNLSGSNDFLEAVNQGDFERLNSIYLSNPNLDGISRGVLFMAFSRLLGKVRENKIKENFPLLIKLKEIFNRKILSDQNYEKLFQKYINKINRSNPQ